MHILTVVVTPIVVLQIVFTTSSQPATLWVVMWKPLHMLEWKKKEREFVKNFEEVLKHFLIVHLNKKRTGSWEIWKMVTTSLAKCFASAAIVGNGEKSTFNHMDETESQPGTCLLPRNIATGLWVTVLVKLNSDVSLRHSSIHSSFGNSYNKGRPI